MPTITIKNMPSELYEKLKKEAQHHRRSINNEAIWCIESTVKSRKINPDEVLLRIEVLQKQISIPPLTDKLLQKIKSEGRA